MIGTSIQVLRGAPCVSHFSGQQASRQRRRQLGCRSQAAPGNPGQPSREEVLDRINKAREYKKGGQQSSPTQPSAAAAAAAAAIHPPPLPPPPAGPAAASALPTSGVDVEQAFGQAAQQLASKEEAVFLQAVSQASSATSSSSSSSSDGGMGGSSTGNGGPTAGRPSSSDAILARMEAARRYKQQGGSSNVSSSTGGGSAAVGAASGPATAPAPASSAAAKDAELEQQRSFRTGSGGADQAANWLQFAEKGDAAAAAIDQSLSAEQFTIAKEELKKQQEVEIITIDARYADQVRQEKLAQQQQQQQQGGGGPATAEEQERRAGAATEGGSSSAEGAEAEDLHKPKVATWGVFPRPRNISEAYGGGRNLRPGQALESEEEAKEREERVNAALKRYRQTLGLDIDPKVEAQAQALYSEGVDLFDQGLITSALPKFAEAAELMALRTRLGGEARLQQAICLDSLGKNQEAYDIYTKIENHPAPGVAKKAKRMLFGWKAAENLKTTKLSYSPSSAQWKRYFDAINRNAAYAAWVGGEQEEEAKGDGLAAALALGVMLMPVGLVLLRVLVAQ